MATENFYHNKITALLFPFGGHYTIRVGEYGVTAIKEEQVRGDMSMVPWFQVLQGDVTVAMVNAAHVETVEYVTPQSGNIPF